MNLTVLRICLSNFVKCRKESNEISFYFAWYLRGGSEKQFSKWLDLLMRKQGTWKTCSGLTTNYRQNELPSIGADFEHGTKQAN